MLAREGKPYNDSRYTDLVDVPRNLIPMKSNLVHLTYQIELLPGEKLHLPDALVESVGEGRWLITVQPVNGSIVPSHRRHTAFLNGYAPEDEGLYDADPAR